MQVDAAFDSEQFKSAQEVYIFKSAEVFPTEELKYPHIVSVIHLNKLLKYSLLGFLLLLELACCFK